MPRVAPTAGFEKYLSELLKKREEYQKGLNEIDTLFGKWGISVETPAVKRGPGRPKTSPAPAAPAAPVAGRKQQKRGKFAETAEQFIVSLLGGKGMATAEINKAWQQAGRGGRADQSLAKMVHAKKVKRTSVPGLRGSKYTVA